MKVNYTLQLSLVFYHNSHRISSKLISTLSTIEILMKIGLVEACTCESLLIHKAAQRILVNISTSISPRLPKE